MGSEVGSEVGPEVGLEVDPLVGLDVAPPADSANETTRPKRNNIHQRELPTWPPFLSSIVSQGGFAAHTRIEGESVPRKQNRGSRLWVSQQDEIKRQEKEQKGCVRVLHSVRG